MRNLRHIALFNHLFSVVSRIRYIFNTIMTFYLRIRTSIILIFFIHFINNIITEPIIVWLTWKLAELIGAQSSLIIVFTWQGCIRRLLGNRAYLISIWTHYGCLIITAIKCRTHTEFNPIHLFLFLNVIIIPCLNALAFRTLMLNIVLKGWISIVVFLQWIQSSWCTVTGHFNIRSLSWRIIIIIWTIHVTLSYLHHKFLPTFWTLFKALIILDGRYLELISQ